MAYYLVTAKPKSDRVAILLRNLRRRAYVSMRPFGRAMSYALENARLREDGYATWEEEARRDGFQGHVEATDGGGSVARGTDQPTHG
jgi:hypothetical protein